MKLQNINSNNSDELIKILRSIDISVPSRSQGRKTEQTEIWSIVRYLLTCCQNNKLDFPLSLKHQDRPDFLLTLGQVEYGIECTEAIPEQMAWAIDLWEKHFTEGYFESEFFRWGSPKRTKQEILEILTKSQNKLHGSGWIGNSVEHEWAKWMIDCINSKTKILNKIGFQKYAENYLIVYDNLPQAANDLSISTNKLNELMSDYWGTDKIVIFDKVLIESKNCIIGYSVSNYLIMQIPNIGEHSRI